MDGTGFPSHSTVDLTMRGADNPDLRRMWPASATGTFLLVRMGPFVSRATKGLRAPACCAGPFMPGAWSLTASADPAKAAVVPGCARPLGVHGGPDCGRLQLYAVVSARL